MATKNTMRTVSVRKRFCRCVDLARTRSELTVWPTRFDNSTTLGSSATLGRE